ncbi:hypothetical protein [Spirosoma koreense]
MSLKLRKRGSRTEAVRRERIMAPARSGSNDPNASGAVYQSDRMRTYEPRIRVAHDPGPLRQTALVV